MTVCTPHSPPHSRPCMSGGCLAMSSDPPTPRRMSLPSIYVPCGKEKSQVFLKLRGKFIFKLCPKTDWKKQPGSERNTRDTIFISFKPKSKLFHFILLIINFFCASPVAVVIHQQTCTTGGTGWTQRQRVGLQAKGSQSPRPTSLSITHSLGLQDMDSAASYLGSGHCPWACALWLLPLTSMTMPSHLYFSSVAVTLPQRGFPDHTLDVSAPSAQQIDCLVLASILCCNHHYLKWSFFFFLG